MRCRELFRNLCSSFHECKSQVKFVDNPQSFRINSGDKAEYSEHHLILSGLKAKGFARIVESLKDIDAMMSRETSGEWKDWKPSKHFEYPMVALSCRLLTPSSQCEKTDDRIEYEIPSEYDPDGVLFGLVASQKYKILTENKISLYRLVERHGSVNCILHSTFSYIS